MKDFKHREPMMSQRTIEKEYRKLEIKPAEPNRVNCYICSSCRYITKTIDRHHGVTPMFNRCISCGKQSVSTWYKDIAPNQKPTHEWVVPTLKELMKYRNNPGMIDHILRGGLDFRRITLNKEEQ